jgi:outer membrane protein OmpA-like peptidoglycan-associated protein
MWPINEFSTDSFEGSTGNLREVANRNAMDPASYPELFPELEVASVRSQPTMRRIGRPFRQSRLAQRVSPVAAIGCLLRRDSEILDFFLFNSSALRPFHIREIRAIAQRIVRSLVSTTPSRLVTIVGHTDERGTDLFNLDLGKKRARATAVRLSLELGANASKVRVFTSSLGESSPIAPNSFDRGRACNQRVQLFFGGPTSGCLGRSARDFFTEYDLRTFPAPSGKPFGIDANPAMSPTEKAQRKSVVIGLVPVLQARLANRAAVSVNQPANIPIPPPDINAVKRLSTVQLQLFRESFPAPSGGLDIDAVRRAFYDFANGDLRTPEIGPNLGVGEPDSSAFFLFAEFSLLCVSNGIDVQDWAQILPWFVSAQEIFIYAYRKKSHAVPPAVNAPLPPVCSPLRHPLSTYDHKNFDGRGQSSEQRKADLLSKYSGMSLNQLQNATKENLLRAQCAP